MKRNIQKLSLLALLICFGAATGSVVQANDDLPLSNRPAHLLDSARIYDLSSFCAFIHDLPSRNRVAFSAVCNRLERPHTNVDIAALIATTPAFQSMQTLGFPTGPWQGRIAVIPAGESQLVEDAQVIEVPASRSRRRSSAPRFDECERDRTRFRTEYWNQAARFSETSLQEIVAQQALHLERIVVQAQPAVDNLKREVRLIQARSQSYSPNNGQSVIQRVSREIIAAKLEFANALIPITNDVLLTNYLAGRGDTIWAHYYFISEQSNVALRLCTEINHTENQSRTLCTLYSYPMGLMLGTSVASAAAVADRSRDLELSTWLPNIQTIEDHIQSRMTGHQRRVCIRRPSPTVFMPRILQDIGAPFIEAFDPFSTAVNVQLGLNEANTAPSTEPTVPLAPASSSEQSPAEPAAPVGAPAPVPLPHSGDELHELDELNELMLQNIQSTTGAPLNLPGLDGLLGAPAGAPSPVPAPTAPPEPSQPTENPSDSTEEPPAETPPDSPQGAQK